MDHKGFVTRSNYIIHSWQHKFSSISLIQIILLSITDLRVSHAEISLQGKRYTTLPFHSQAKNGGMENYIQNNRATF